MSGPAALHTAMPVAIGQCLLMMSLWQTVVSMALLHGFGHGSVEAQGRLKRRKIKSGPFPEFHERRTNWCICSVTCRGGRVFCTRPHGLAYEFGRRQLPQRAPTTATSNGNGGDAGVWRSVSIMCTVLFEVARLGLVSVGVRTCTVLGRSSCASELHSNFV